MHKSGTFIVSLFVLCVLILPGSIEAQWRGAQRDGIYPGENLIDLWPESGPERLWSAEGIGAGFSSVAVTADRVFVTGLIEKTGYLFAFDLNGTQIWKSSYGPEWSTSYPGARSTPVVVGNRIYLMSALGNVLCFNSDGKKIWSVDIAKQFQYQELKWGFTESVLVDGDRVFCTPGGPTVAVAALDRHTGEILWASKANGEASSYCSPLLVTHNNRRLVVTMTARSVIGIDANTGEFLWRHDHVTKYNINPNTPLYHDGRLFILSGYGTGSQKLKLNQDGSAVEQVWSQPILDSQFGSAILVDGFLYGSGQRNKGWHCVDWDTGEVKYTDKTLGNKGNIIYADGMAYCYNENGNVGLVKLAPEAFEVVSSFTIDWGTAQHWAHPVIRDGRFYVRHGNVLTVYDISAK